jgi:4a-hydroxytetrahydrobiopterin dehydratase
MDERLSRERIAAELEAADGWELAGDAIRKRYEFASFPDAMAFVNRVAAGAEAADHHPDILVSYRRVTLTYSTDSAGGLTVKDFDGARMADHVA